MNRSLKLLFLAVFVFALSAPLAATEVLPSFSQSGGDPAGGWFWLDPSHPGTVTFTFDDGNAAKDVARRQAAIRCGTFAIPVVAAVTNTAGGGGGHDKVIRMRVISEGKYEDQQGGWTEVGQASGRPEVVLSNPAPVTAANPPGSEEGYEAKGNLRLPPTVCENFKLTGRLVVTYAYARDERESWCCPGTADHDPFMDHRVAFSDSASTGTRQSSLVIRY